MSDVHLKQRPPNVRSQIAQLPDSWRACLSQPHLEPAIAQLDALLEAESAQKKAVYPAAYFRALTYASPLETRAVILGQDPYAGAGQANGLAFSVAPGLPLPGSLRNIFKELQRDLEIPPARCGDLSRWAQQGVLLLNTVLSVREQAIGSHRGYGWEALTDALIQRLAASDRSRIFLLWGRDAQKKKPLLENTPHLLLSAAHPSPLSAHRGFIGCGHFSKTNAALREQKETPINWQLPAAL